MVSLDNLKTAMAAIKAEINSIVIYLNSRFLKKTDASSIYVTKDSANKSFATKSSVTDVGYFSESQDTLTSIGKLRFPYFSRANRTLGTVEYNPRQSNLGDLGIAGVNNIGFVFNLPESYEANVTIGYPPEMLKSPGGSVSGTFAGNDTELNRVKKVALSNAQDEYSTPTKNQGTMYYNIRVINVDDGGETLSFKLSASNNPNSPRLQGMAYGNSGELYYFVSDEISSDSTVNIPFTLTRIDRYEKLPNPSPIHIRYYDKGNYTVHSETVYDGTAEKYVDIYRDVLSVRLKPQGTQYYSDLTYRTISNASDDPVVATVTYDGSIYHLPLACSHFEPRPTCIFIGLVNKSDHDATFMMFNGEANAADSALYGTIETCTVRTASAQDAIDSGKVDKVTGKGLSSNDYTAAAKAKVDAIPANPKYTDTVYDDTALKQRVATIEGKESAWDAKSDFSGSYNDLTDKPAPLIGTTNELTPTQVYDAVSSVIPVRVQYTDSTYGLLSFTAFNVAETLKVIVSQTIVYYNGNYILAELFGNVIQGGGWGFYSTMLSELKDLDNLDVRVNKLEGAGYLTLETLPKYGGESE